VADIDVVPKKRTSVWLWIIIAIVGALIVFALLGGFAGTETTRTGEVIDRPTLAAIGV
jgi:bacteriorhodopsin